MKALTTATILLLAISMFAQDGMEITLKQSDNNASCVSILLTSSNSDDILLRGQNYRLFYNNANLKYNSIKIHSALALNNFEAEVAMHRDGLSKEINGNISFENNMGFISMNVMPEDEIADFVYMEGHETMTIADVCFSDDVNLDDFVLAKLGITNDYAAAYSVVDWDAAEGTTKKESYTMGLNSFEEENDDK